VSRSRLYLHLAALLAPLVAASVWCLFLYRAEVAAKWGVVAVVVGLAILSAQMAALLRWRPLDARARAGSGAWRAGIGMAAITHALFGVFLDVALIFVVGGWSTVAGTGHASDLFPQAFFFIVASVLPLGLVTFPATAVFATWIATLRRKEFGDAIA